ncbi:ArsR/SmtB family transcription factor [Natrinema salsiterrestre]|uniref:Winged helix-turn-helix domain-containing protein n=1 Tax=Natrinema salsiterrestre TaxID=2950540 RepID=A0A9Q4Q068_9EURY|nr:winged helix-turn-helix domain-containing protein [Natrinema salsiterrestre]MDF9745454.1 winged helix-turn-helix domain-containing protein [Natrinema salsiterrestre]
MSERQIDGSAPPDDSQTVDCCSAGHSLPEDAVAADVQTLATLGNKTRYEALRLIAAADDGICVCELEPSLAVSQGAVSQALSRLFSAGLVDRRKEGRWRYYTATPRAERLLRVLDDTRSLDDD